MDARTLEALKASIEKWELNAVADSPLAYLTGPEDCALCREFFWKTQCMGCPVREHTKLSVCDGSPYSEAYRAWSRWKDSGEVAKANAHAAAREEVAFLKSLLPVEEQ